MESKICSKCHKEKMLIDFHRHPTASKGFSNYCKSCNKEYSKERYNRNKENVIKRALVWAKENPEKRKLIVKKSDDKHRDKKRKKENDRHRQKRIDDPEQVKIIGIQAAAIRRSREMMVERTVSRAELREIIKKADGVCVYCGEKVGKLTIDHFHPISQFGSHSKDNLIPCCKTCNCSKHSRVGEDRLAQKHGEEGLARAIVFLEGGNFHSIL
jgi:5-methylcytosine-specific restriction endonuclease McrA